MKKIKNKIQIILITFALIMPILITILPTATADWIYPSPVTNDESGGVNYLNPSIAINKNDKTIDFAYTWDNIGDDYDFIYIGNNTEPIEGFNGNVLGIPDFYDMFEITGLYSSQLLKANNCQVASNGITGDKWFVFQAQVEGESDLEIFLLSYNSTNYNFMRLTFNDYDDMNPTIASSNWIIDGRAFAFISYERDIGGDHDIVYRYTWNLDPGVEMFIGNSDGINQTNPKMSSSRNGDYDMFHLCYIRDSNSIYYSNISYYEDFNNLTTKSASVASGAVISNITIDSQGDYVVIAYNRGGNIAYLRSSDKGLTFPVSNNNLVSAGSYPIGKIDAYVTDFGNIEIIYERTMSASRKDIYVANNFRTGNSWTIDNLLFGGTNNVRFSNPCFDYYNNTIVGLFEKQTFSAFWSPINIQTFGYELFYKKSASVYNIFELVNEDPAGTYLIDGFQIMYNGSDTDVDLNFTYRDKISGFQYNNITRIKNDGSQTNYYFYDPEKYIISQNSNIYDLKIDFVSTSDQILRVMFNPAELIISHSWTYLHTYNLTSHNYEQGNKLPYLLEMGTSFDYSGKFTKFNEGSVLNTLTSTNYADYGLISMNSGDWYNFTFTTNQQNIIAYLFNSSIQQLNFSNAIYIWNHTQIGPSGGTTKNEMRCNVTGNYYVLIQKTNPSTNVQYFFDYQRFPRNITLSSPTNNSVLNWDTTKSVTLKWARNSADTDLKFYYLQVSNDSTFTNNVYNYTVLAALSSQYTFTQTAPEKWFYWRVKASDVGGNEGFYNTVYRFGFDAVTPTSPNFTIYPNNKTTFQTKTYQIEWEPPRDGLYENITNYFTYNVYRSTDKDFIPGPSNMISTPGVLKVPRFVDEVNRNDKYYYYVEAIDGVGHKSPLSNRLEVTYSYGGTVDASQQEGFQILVGDILEYKITWVQSNTLDVYRNPLMNLYDKWFPTGTRFHFWVKNIDKQDVYAISGDWYSYAANDTYRDYYYLEERDINLAMFVTNTNESYQEAVYNLVITQMLTQFHLGDNLFLTKYYSTWTDGLQVSDVVCYTYATAPGEDRDQTSVTFVVDRATGVLVEMTYYDHINDYGWSIRLMTYTTELSTSGWSYAPIGIPIFIGAIAGVVYAILKKIEL